MSRLGYRLLAGAMLAVLFLSGPGGAAAAEPAIAHGRVYLVEADENRTPLPGTLVTDGYILVETDQDGRYELPLHEAARWVAFINPRGTMPNPDLHHLLPADRSSLPAFDFTVKPLPQSPDESFYFTHQSDLHLARDYHIDMLQEAIGRHLTRIPEGPLFVLDSGDVSNDSIERMEWARELFDLYPLPVFAVMGNHDTDRAGREDYRGQTMEQLFSPFYYAFTFGNYLFLNYPWSFDRDEAVAWTEVLVERLNGEFHLVTNMHHWDGLRGRAADLVRLLVENQAKGAFSGHYHTTQILTVQGIPTFGINSGRSHIRDLGRPSFFLIRAEPDGRLTADHRKTGFERQLELVHPPRELSLEANWSRGLKRGSSIPLLVNAADTAIKVRSVQVTVTEEGGSPVLTQLDLEHGGGWAWTGRLEVPLDWPDPILLRVEAIDQTGAMWPVIERRIWVADPGPTPQVRVDHDWGMYQGGPGRSGAAASGPKPPLELAWVHANRNFGLSAPIVAGGRVFAGIMNNSEPVEPWPVVVALDAATGQTIWTHQLAGGQSPRSTLAADREHVFYQACDGSVATLDAATGQTLWSSELMRSELSSAQIFQRGSPGLSGQTAWAGAARFASAFALADGEVRWARLPDSGSRSWANPSLAMRGNLVYSPEGGSLHALDSAEGEPVWTASIAGNMTPVLDGEKLYLGARVDGQWQLQALNRESGEIIWQTKLETGPGFASPATADGRVFLSLDHSLHAFNTDNGQPLWQSEIGATRVSPVVVGEHVFAVTGGGRLVALSAATGEPVWEYKLGTMVTSGLAVSGNALFVTGRNGALYAFSQIED